MLVWSVPSNAQDNHFSQVLYTPQLMNPASTGMFVGGYRVYLNYRSQWATLGSPFKTMGGSFDTKIGKKKKDGGYLGLGLNVFNDKAGDGNFGLMKIALNVSGVMPIGRDQWASAGLMIGGGQYSVDMQNLTWGNQFNGAQLDPQLASGEADALTTSVFYDLAAGVNYRYSNMKDNFIGEDLIEWDIGAAYFHVNKPDVNFISGEAEGILPKLVVRTSLRKDFKGTTVGIVPFAQYVRQGPHTELNVGTLLRFKLKTASKITDIFSESALSVGVQYRNNAAIIPQVMLEFSGWGIGFAYDYNISPLSELTGSTAMEISIRYTNFNEPRISTKSRKGGARM